VLAAHLQLNMDILPSSDQSRRNDGMELSSLSHRNISALANVDQD
jgi:hypothetical protein